MSVPSVTQINDFSFTTKKAVFASTGGCLGSYLLSVNPAAGVVWGVSHAVMSKINSVVFHQQGADFSSRFIGNFLTCAVPVALTMIVFSVTLPKALAFSIISFLFMFTFFVINHKIEAKIEGDRMIKRFQDHLASKK